MDDKESEFGYKVVKISPPPKKYLITFACDRCDSTDIEAKWWCSWDVELQRWEACDNFDEYYCRNCGDETEVTEVSAE
jgi:hypothetical protein